MTTPSAAYFAGFFDGEGTININIRQNGCATIYVSVGSTDMKVTELFKETFGGCLTTPRISSKLSKRLSREWKVTNDSAVEFLKAVFPFLVVKKRQAALAFKARNVVTQNLRSKDEHRLELLRNIAEEVKSLNRPHVETVKGTLPILEVNSQSIELVN